MRARLLCEFETDEAGFRVTEDGAQRVEFEVKVGSAVFSARLTGEQADELEEALRRRSELRRLRAVPRRVTT